MALWEVFKYWLVSLVTPPTIDEGEIIPVGLCRVLCVEGGKLSLFWLFRLPLPFVFRGPSPASMDGRQTWRQATIYVAKRGVARKFILTSMEIYGGMFELEPIWSQVTVDHEAGKRIVKRGYGQRMADYWVEEYPLPTKNKPLTDEDRTSLFSRYGLSVVRSEHMVLGDCTV